MEIEIRYINFHLTDRLEEKFIAYKGELLQEGRADVNYTL